MKPTRRAGGVVFGAVVLVAILAAVFRGPLLRPLVVLVLRQTLGLHATIARIGGSVLGDLELRGVSARAEPGSGPLVAFEAERISARYDLAALLRGTGAFLDSLDITVERAGVELDQGRAPPAGAAPAGQQAAGFSLPRLPRLTVIDSRVRFLAEGYTLEADGLQGTVARADQAHEQAVELRAGRFSLRHPALREGVVSLAVAGRIAPRHLAITSAQLNGEQIAERARLALGEHPGELDLQLALKLWQGSVEIGVLRRAAGTEVRWDARGVDLQPQLVLVNPALGALRGQLSTEGQMRLGGSIAALTGTFSLDWKGAVLVGRAVDHLVIEGSAEPGAVLVERAEGRVGTNELQLHQVTLPAGPLFEGRWRALLAAASGSFDASLGDVPAFLALWGVRVGDRAATVPKHHLRLQGSLEKGTLQLARGDLATGLGKATLEAAVVSFPREDQGWGATSFSGSATVDLPNLRDVSDLFPVPALSGSLRGEISGTGTVARPEGRAFLTGRRIEVAGKNLGDVVLRAHSSAGRIEFDTLELVQGGNRFTAKGARFAPAALAAPDRGAFFDSLAGSFALSTTDVPGLAALAGIPTEQAVRIPAAHLLTASGTVLGRTIEVSAASFTAAGGSITLRGVHVALPGPGANWTKDTAFEGDLAVDIPDLGSVATIFHLPQLRGALTGKARISGSAAEPGGSVEAAGRGIAIGGHRVGDVVLKAAARRQRLEIETLEVGRGEDRLRGRGVYDLGKGTFLDMEADLSVADVAPYLAEFVREGIPVSGRLHAVLRAAGPLSGAPLAVEAEFSEGRVWEVLGVHGSAKARVAHQGPLRQLRIGSASLVTEAHGEAEGRGLKVLLEAAYEPGRLSIGAFEIAGAAGLTVKGEGTVPLDFAADEMLSPGPLSLKAKASIPALEDLAFLLPPAFAPAGSLHADIAVTGPWKKPDARLEIRGERLQFPAETRFAPPGPHTLSGTLVWGTAEARVEKVRLESPSLSLSLSGIWSSPPTLPSLFAGTGGAKTGSLSLRASVSSPDIGWLRKSVEGLRGLRGSVAGEIAIDGPAGDPAVSGEIRIAGGAVRFRNLPPLESLAARASVMRRLVTLETVSGNVGGSPFTLAGSVDFSRSDDPTLNLRLQGKDALLYRDEFLRLRADSDLTLSGPVSALSLTGEVALTNSLYQKTFSVANLFSGGGKSSKRTAPGTTAISFPEPPLRNMRFDVHLTARQPFQIETTVVRGRARPDLRLTGTGLLPILRGPILFDAAQLILPSGTLEAERGLVIFGDRDQGRPVLDFGGRMEISGYEITAQIGGTLDNPEVVLASTPPLPQEELLLFVLTGAPPASGGANGNTVSTMATPLAVYLGKGVLDQLLGGGGAGKGSDLAGRLELQIGRETTQSGSATVDARLRLKKNFIAKGGTLYFTSEKDVYDQENLGLKIIFKYK